MKLSIVVPVYNEEQNILELLSRVVGSLERAGLDFEIVAIDDGSRDRSFELMREAYRGDPRVRLIRFATNYGQTAAIAAGFKHASGDVLVPIDADLQNDPDDIPRIVARLDEGYDVVSGWRRARKDPLFSKKIPSKVANWIIARATNTPIHDFGCTLKAYRRDVLEDVRLYGEMHRFIPAYAVARGARVAEMVVTHHPRTRGRSNYGLSRIAKVMLDLITVLFLGAFSNKPIYLFGGVGLVSMGSGFGCGAAVLILKYGYGYEAHKNPLLLLAVFLFIVGLLFVGMGIMSEILMRTYHESQGKDPYRIRERVNF